MIKHASLASAHVRELGGSGWAPADENSGGSTRPRRGRGGRANMEQTRNCTNSELRTRPHVPVIPAPGAQSSEHADARIIARSITAHTVTEIHALPSCR